MQTYYIETLWAVPDDFDYDCFAERAYDRLGQPLVGMRSSQLLLWSYVDAESAEDAVERFTQSVESMNYGVQLNSWEEIDM